MRRQLAVLMLTLASAGAAARAQSLPEGTRIRLHIPAVSEDLLYGRVLRLTSDSIALRDVHGYVPDGTYFARRVSVPRGAATGLEYTRWRDRATGAWYGAALGLIPAAIAYYDRKRSDYPEYAGMHMVLVGTISVSSFALIGSYFGPERWERVLPWP